MADEEAILGLLLGGSWDIAITYIWAYSPVRNWSNLRKASLEKIRRLIGLGVSSY